jgi:hypothetical protein
MALWEPKHVAALFFWLIPFYIIKLCYAESVEITNKMQTCNSICYSNVYWRQDGKHKQHEMDHIYILQP